MKKHILESSESFQAHARIDLRNLAIRKTMEAMKETNTEEQLDNIISLVEQNIEDKKLINATHEADDIILKRIKKFKK